MQPEIGKVYISKVGDRRRIKVLGIHPDPRVPGSVKIRVQAIDEAEYEKRLRAQKRAKGKAAKIPVDVPTKGKVTNPTLNSFDRTYVPEGVGELMLGEVLVTADRQKIIEEHIRRSIALGVDVAISDLKSKGIV